MSYTYVVPYGFYGAPITNRLPNKAANSACNYYVDLRNQISYPNVLGNVVITSVNSDYINAGSLTIVSLGSSGSVAGFNISNGTEAVNYFIKASAPIITPTNAVVETYNVEFTLPVGVRTSAYDKLILEGDVTGIGLGIVQTSLSNSANTVIQNIVTNALTNVATSNTTNAVQNFPLTFSYSGNPGSSQAINYAVSNEITFSISSDSPVYVFRGSGQQYNSAFTLQVIQANGNVESIANILLYEGGGVGGQFAVTVNNSYTSQGGDMLQLVSSPVVDNELSNVAITIIAQRTF